jgi:hypothetical protein
LNSPARDSRSLILTLLAVVADNGEPDATHQTRGYLSLRLTASTFEPDALNEASSPKLSTSLPNIDTARERFQTQRYLDSMEQVDSEQASEVDNAAVTLFLLLHPPLRASRRRSLFFVFRRSRKLQNPAFAIHTPRPLKVLNVPKTTITYEMKLIESRQGQLAIPDRPGHCAQRAARSLKLSRIQSPRTRLKLANRQTQHAGVLPR